MVRDMTKREAVEEIARCAGTLHVCSVAKDALAGKVSLDRALHETAAHAGTLHAKIVAEEAIDKG